MKLATDLAQNYNPDFFNSDLVLHIQRKDYGLIPQFDKNVLIILKATIDTSAHAFKTIKSLFVQSYKLPKVILLVADADNVVKENFIISIPKELNSHIGKELFIEFNGMFSLPVIKQKFQDYVLVTVENGTLYQPKWLRSIMAAYSDNRDAFKCLTFDNPDTLDDEILFKDFAVIDTDPSEKVTVLKSKQIIVSVTSYPARSSSVALALETIYGQFSKSDKVIMWLASSQFPGRDEEFPKELRKLVSEKGLVIQWCDDDLKPYEKYFTLRMDIRNRGNKGCNVLEQGIVPRPFSVRRPQWLPDGITVESVAERMSVDVQCKGDGELEIGLMGQDVRNEDGKRYPVWIDCTYFAVNGEVIFDEIKTVCHDKRYVYRKPVADGENVRLEVTWSECRSSNVLDEYRQLRKANARILKELNEAQRKAAKLDKELLSVKSGWSYKIGKMITWLPKKIKSGLTK